MSRIPLARVSDRTHGLRAPYSTSRPPPPTQPYRSIPPKDVFKPSEPVPEVETPRKKSLLSRMSPFQSDPSIGQPRDFARGIAASQRVVRTGVLDPRYRPAAARVTAIICALPIALYLTWELYQRRFMGKEQKVRKVKKEPVGEEEAT